MTREFTILIVDDDADLASNVGDVFEVEGYSSVVATDGQTALVLCKERVFDLALIDIRLPDIPGVELVEKLVEVYPAMEHILITGYATVESAAEAVRQRSIIAYETKPLNIDQLMALVRQVASRKQVEETLKESEKFNSSLLKNSPNPIIVINPDSSIKYVNPAFETLTCFSSEEVIGIKPPFPWWRKEVVHEAKVVFEEYLRGGVLNHEWLLRKKSGEYFWVVITGKPVITDGKIQYQVSNWIDITKNKRMEEQLRHSQLLASLGEMTAGITHEVGNPLASILLYSEAAMKGSVSRQTRKDLKVIHNEAKRAGKLMKDLLAYSRKLEPKIQRLNLHSVIKKVLDMRQYQQKVHNIRTATYLRYGPLYIQGDSSQLTQVFLNLIINAEEAIKESNGKNIEITSQIDGEWAKVSIADDGIGIPEKNLNQVFHPFFSTKKVGEGTGLGLSTCYGIITAQGGLIRAENNEMGGATFTVQLPLSGMGRQGILPLEIKEASS